jgi:hypothetical protein
MHDRKHLVLVGPRIFADSVVTQRVGRAAAALIQRSNESGMCLHLLQLFFEIARLDGQRVLVRIERHRTASFRIR